MTHLKGTIIAAAVIAAAILISAGIPWAEEAQPTGPWQMMGTLKHDHAWRINTATGEMELCRARTKPEPCAKVPSP